MTPQRYRPEPAGAPRFVLGAALRDALLRGYGAGDLRADLLAGITVGIVALPLAMALAIASGAPPQHGLYTSMVAGLVTPLLGGSRVNVTGPTAAFVVLLLPVTAKHGLAGLAVASAMAGLILIVMGAVKLGGLIQYVPHPVTTGFTAGIAVVIATLQIRDLLGLKIEGRPEHFLERMSAIVDALPTFQPGDVVIGAFTLAVLVTWPRVSKKVPGPLVAVALASALAYAFRRFFPELDAATIESRFGGIPRRPPMPAPPWTLPGPHGEPFELTFATIRELAAPAFAIAMLGAIESLLCAVVADGMAGTKHDADGELVGQGIGNLLAPFFGGFAATGALARTATSIRAGARSPIAAATHAAFLLVAVLAIAPWLAALPMAALAALLLVVAWNMSDARHFVHVVRVAPKSDVAVLLACFALTVAFDMVIAVGVGVLLAAGLFLRRMAEITGGKLLEAGHHRFDEPLPPGVFFYEIAGPLFFGAAEKAIGALQTVAGRARVVILDVESVPAMDATGLVALESAIDKLHKAKAFVIVMGVQPQPERVLEKAGLLDRPERLVTCATIDQAIAAAKRALAKET